LGKGLSKTNFKINMVCASGKNFDLLIRKKIVNSNFTIYTLPRIKYHQYFSGQILRLFLTLPFVLFSKYDICHAFTIAQPQIAIPAWISKVVRNKKLIIDWDDMWGGGFADEHSNFISKILNWHERYFLQFADKITYVSDFIEREIIKTSKIYQKLYTIEKVKIPNGANIKQIQVMDKINSRKILGIKKKEHILLSMGNTYTDSLRVLLEALKKVCLEKGDIKLYLVGSAVIPKRYKELFDELKDNIILVGSVPFELVPLYLSSSDILVLPMEDNSIEKARFPMRFGDYLAAGRPIVSNAVGEVKLYLEKYSAGMVSSPTSPEELGENILLLSKNKEYGSELAANARKLAENDLSWKKINNSICNIYNGL